MDVQAICRLCSFKLHKSQNIFTTPDLLQKILKFTDIEIEPDDGLPASICDMCSIKLQIMNEFRLRAREVDKLIRTKQAKLTQTTPSYSSSKNLARIEDHVSKSACESVNHEETKQFASGRQGNKHQPHRALSQQDIPSGKTGRSFERSYKTLPNLSCPAENAENFPIPSCIAFHNEDRAEKSQDDCEANANQGSSLQELPSIAVQVPPHESGVSEDHVAIDIFSVTADPLNLLRVKYVRPILDYHCNNWRTATDCRNEFRQEAEPQLVRRSATDDFEKFQAACRFSTNSETTLITDRRESNFDSSSFTAPNPNEIFASPKKQQGKASCPVCDKICANIRGVKVHLNVHRAKFCPICYVPTCSKEKYREHMKNHLLDVVKTSFACTLCRRVFQSNSGLCNHMRSHSRSVPPATRLCP